jgi:hypothetical protein
VKEKNLKGCVLEIPRDCTCRVSKTKITAEQVGADKGFASNNNGLRGWYQGDIDLSGNCAGSSEAYCSWVGNFDPNATPSFGTIDLAKQAHDKCKTDLTEADCQDIKLTVDKTVYKLCNYDTSCKPINCNGLEEGHCASDANFCVYNDKCEVKKSNWKCSWIGSDGVKSKNDYAEDEFKGTLVKPFGKCSNVRPDLNQWYHNQCFIDGPTGKAYQPKENLEPCSTDDTTSKPKGNNCFIKQIKDAKNKFWVYDKLHIDYDVVDNQVAPI